MSVERSELFLGKEVKIINGPHTGCKGRIVGIFSEDSGLTSDVRVHITDHQGRNPRAPGKYVKHAYFKLKQIAIKEKIKMMAYQAAIDGRYFMLEEGEEPKDGYRRKKDLDVELEVWK